MSGMSDPIDDDVADRVGEVVDLFARDKSGRSRGVHHLMGALAKNDKGAPLPTLSNVTLILAHDPPLAGLLGYNEFTYQHLLMRAPPPLEDGGAPLPGPYPRPWETHDVGLVLAYVQRVWCHRVGLQTVEHAMLTEASQRRFHPVRDWLATLRWDGEPRLDTWLSVAFGAPKDQYHTSVGSKILIAATRRVRQPGCKFDEMPILEGPQGIGKSRAVEALFGPAWYSDSMHSDLADRDAAIALHGVWGFELPEIDVLIRNEIETVKAFLSRAVDRYRPINGKAVVSRPRQGVMIGTTNEDDYLRDATGNRRFWPVKCQGADAEWITANRDQLWAEACVREAAGEALWLDDEEASTQAVAEQSGRLQDDAWEHPVAEWLAGRSQVRMDEVLGDALLLPRAQQDRRSEMRAGKILRRLGWARKVVREGGKLSRRWLRMEAIL